MANRRTRISSFLDRIQASFPAAREAAIHPHCPEERAELYSAVNVGSGEVEVLNFVNALVRLYKPRTLLETGTGHGFTAIAIAEALRQNGFGHLNTVEVDAATVQLAKANLVACMPELQPFVTYHCSDSLALIQLWPGEPFDFVLFDSLVAFRHIEFEQLLKRGLLQPGALCCFHDTSRLRGQTMRDYNPEMIAALDKTQRGPTMA